MDFPQLKMAQISDTDESVRFEQVRDKIISYFIQNFSYNALHHFNGSRTCSMTQAKKLLGADKLSRIPVKIENTDPPLRKPDWIRIKIPSDNKGLSA